jgi:pimeloyl-ACP methyl ester carboxylesterase
MSFPNLFAKRSARPSKGAHSRADKAGPESERAALASEAEQKLARNPTLAVYGDQDVFVAAKRLREWASRLERVPESKFRAHEISTAGHFWAEERVAYIMKDAVRTFAEELIAPESELHVAKPL